MASAYVDDLINKHKVVVFSKTYCPYCAKTKHILSKYNIKDIVIVELDELEDCEKIRSYLATIGGARSVPKVFINGQFIGGADDTASMDAQQKLKPLLESIGAID